MDFGVGVVGYGFWGGGDDPTVALRLNVRGGDLDPDVGGWGSGFRVIGISTTIQQPRRRPFPYLGV